jgi:hypothetical protein
MYDFAIVKTTQQSIFTRDGSKKTAFDIEAMLQFMMN